MQGRRPRWISHSVTGSIFAAGLFLAPAFPARAAVLDSGPTGFHVRSEVMIGAARDRVYHALTEEIGRWWDPAHTWSGDAGNLRLESRPGGCFCEALPGGGGVSHATVIFADPGKTLRLSGALGPLQEGGLSGTLTFTLEDARDSTRLALSTMVGGYFPGGLEKIAPAVDNVLSDQLRRLKVFVETLRR